MKTTFLLVLIAFSLGVLTPQTHATPVPTSTDTTILAVKIIKQPKKQRQAKRPRTLALNLALPGLPASQTAMSAA